MKKSHPLTLSTLLLFFAVVAGSAAGAKAVLALSALTVAGLLLRPPFSVFTPRTPPAHSPPTWVPVPALTPTRAAMQERVLRRDILARDPW